MRAVKLVRYEWRMKWECVPDVTELKGTRKSRSENFLIDGDRTDKQEHSVKPSKLTDYLDFSRRGFDLLGRLGPQELFLCLNALFRQTYMHRVRFQIRKI